MSGPEDKPLKVESAATHKVGLLLHGTAWLIRAITEEE